MNVVVGASRARDIAKTILIKSNPLVEVWSLPGGKYAGMKQLIEKHTLYHHGCPPDSQETTQIYVIAGICDVSQKISSYKNKYKEIVLLENSNDCVTRVKNEIQNLHHHILDLNYSPIFATIIPTHLEKLNFHWLDHNVTMKLDYSHQYSIMQDGLLESIKELNAYIPTINKSLGLSTPCLHRTVLHNKSKGRSYFQHSRLHDGCHADESLNLSLAECLDRSFTLNRP